MADSALCKVADEMNSSAQSSKLRMGFSTALVPVAAGTGTEAIAFLGIRITAKATLPTISNRVKSRALLLYFKLELRILADSLNNTGKLADRLLY